MDDLEEKAIRYDLFKNNFQYAFSKLDDDFKENHNVRFFFDEDWNLFASLNDERLFYAPAMGWIKISRNS